ncbi:MAG: hypothetical protein QOJ59_626 [Thermomicrobiales bacterium]|nr:hypothetical protein [Thermomicrobiales bacterium]
MDEADRRTGGETERRRDGETEKTESSVVGRQSSVLDGDRLWVPDNPDGSGWADVDWVSAVRGSRYRYRHGKPHDEALALLPPFYRVVTRLDTPALHAPHENSYYVPRERLADFLAELALAGGAETIWHVEPCQTPPPESRLL